ncbi:MAG: cation:dicarboxylase symporter family transporter [Acidobacteria bacterium]|nr:cation:dicarboxylase symporter family transporter [Acidobacteriota bacterium]
MKKPSLPTQIAIGMVLGVILGAIVGESIVVIKPLGDLFLRLIRMVVVPLVFASLLVGTATVGDPKKLGRIGGRTLAYYLCTTAIAISLGLLIANVVQPGAGMDPTVQQQLLADFGDGADASVDRMRTRPSVSDALLDIVPENPMSSLANANMLQIIFFALMFGVALTFVAKEAHKTAVLSFFEGVSDAMIQLVHIVMLIAPIGVFALMAAAVGQFGLDVLRVLLLYAACVVVGLLIHMTLVYTTAVKLIAGMSPARFFAGIRPAQIVAFSTSSSGATLPVTMDRARTKLGVPEQVSSFVLPLGATINMDGTALYQGVAAVFIAQVYGIEIGLGGQLTIVLMATLASIGTAAVPGVGIITLAMVLEQIGLPLEGIALILGVDRILDMIRTVTNVTGDASAAVIVAAAEGQLDSEPVESEAA